MAWKHPRGLFGWQRGKQRSRHALLYAALHVFACSWRLSVCIALISYQCATTNSRLPVYAQLRNKRYALLQQRLSSGAAAPGAQRSDTRGSSSSRPAKQQQQNSSQQASRKNTSRQVRYMYFVPTTPHHRRHHPAERSMQTLGHNIRSFRH